MIDTVPWNSRLNEHFVRSDFMYSDTIVRRGLKNTYHIRPLIDQNGQALADLLGHIADEHGHLSIVYGYIDHHTSMKTVKWRNPADPSYHRWDDGAAADIIAHDWVAPQRTQRGLWHPMEDADASPMMLAREIAASHEFSRMITYSESPSICVAAKEEENRTGSHRRAFYENRFEGKQGVKPKYLRYHGRVPTREEVRQGVNQHGWIGKGHPTYHGKGRLQYHHVRIGKYLTLLECLRDPCKLAAGINNRPPANEQGKRMFMHVGHAMSRFIEWYYHYVGQGSISVVAGHNAVTDNMFLLSLFDDQIRTISRDWSTGEGSMIFSIHEDYGPEFSEAWLRDGMEEYNVTWKPTLDSLMIRVSWRKK